MDKGEYTFKISGLIKKYFWGELSEPEREQLNQWLVVSEKHRMLFEKWQKEALVEEKVNNYKRIQPGEALKIFLMRKKEFERRRKNLRLRRFLKYVALFLLPLSVGIMLFSRMDTRKDVLDRQELPVVKAGKPMAILTLPSGQQIGLDGRKGKEVDGTFIVRDSGHIKYLSRGNRVPVEKGVHTISVPRGGEFFIQLWDGSKVWLNAETELRFPEEFGEKERKVYLEGEAFFEVAKDTKKPFWVITDRGQVKVYGTSFNIYSYKDDDVMTTTLAEGCVEVQAKNDHRVVRMIPGEQVLLWADGSLEKNKVDVDLYISWKGGRLMFKSMRLEDLLHNLSRWYDVEIFFTKNNLKDIVFTGDLKKYEDFNEVLEIVKLTSEARFRIEGKKVTVY